MRKFFTNLKQRYKNERNSEAGFSIIEIVVAIPIMTLVLGGAIYGLALYSDLMFKNGQRAEAITNISSYVNDLENVRTCSEFLAMTSTDYLSTNVNNASLGYEVRMVGTPTCTNTSTKIQTRNAGIATATIGAFYKKDGTRATEQKVTIGVR